jgi:hypothetical protein
MVNQTTPNPMEEALASRLREAYRTGAIAPLRDSLDPGDGAGAYRIQEINTRFWESEGRRLVGRKIGLTAKAVQAQLGVDQPDYGALFADMAVPNGGQLDPTRMIQPKAEAEIALVLKADLHGLRPKRSAPPPRMPSRRLKSSTAASPIGRSRLPTRSQTMDHQDSTSWATNSARSTVSICSPAEWRPR